MNGSKKKKKAATASANVRGGGLSISDIAQGKSQAEAGGEDGEENDSDDDELARQINAAASNLATIEVKDEDWAVDMSEEAIRARAKELHGEAAKETTEFTKLEEFGEWVLQSEELPTDVELYKKIAELELLDDPKVAAVLAQVLFDEDIVSDISEHTAFLQKLLKDEDFEKNFLGGIERFLGLDHPDLIPLLPKILVQLYNNDIISEEEIMNFGTKCSKKFVPKDVSKKVRRAAKPFITWLKTADEDDDDEDSE